MIEFIFYLFSMVESLNVTDVNPVYLAPPNLINITYIIEISKNVSSSHMYEFQKFDCTEFSEELSGKLREKGYDAYCVYGIYRPGNYPYHTWTEVNLNGTYLEIESTGGFIITPEDYELNYKTLVKGRCI